MFVRFFSLFFNRTGPVSFIYEPLSSVICEHHLYLQSACQSASVPIGSQVTEMPSQGRNGQRLPERRDTYRPVSCPVILKNDLQSARGVEERPLGASLFMAPPPRISHQTCGEPPGFPREQQPGEGGAQRSCRDRPRQVGQASGEG